ncbi:hypothetical protein NEOLEDRAFT_1196162 [Neolentinus lepideus HHB14362 ss-1]|uniref:BAH domain-containing protein n=1 Tax=Neolentinus lepideus HHB14362 ss-1 TaxID=1314782 RepID=A0A165MBQ7_9AGAM|nr:hypothetical protein NEOLEDRAFT_1196162 [Neolentinus lepideus HHB14362 ss-1]
MLPKTCRSTAASHQVPAPAICLEALRDARSQAQFERMWGMQNMVEPPAENTRSKPVEADQEEVDLFIGRDVFVYPPEMEITNKPNTQAPQKLWKAKILELKQRTGAEQERHKGGMMCVQWYYSPEHLIDLGVKLVEDE